MSLLHYRPLQLTASINHEWIGMKEQVETNACNQVTKLENKLEAARAVADELQNLLGEASSNADGVSLVATAQTTSADCPDQLKMRFEMELKEKDDLACALRKQLTDKDHEWAGLQKAKEQAEVKAVDQVAELESELEAVRAKYEAELKEKVTLACALQEEINNKGWEEGGLGGLHKDSAVHAELIQKECDAKALEVEVVRSPIIYGQSLC